jgi:hypothetical protein
LSLPKSVQKDGSSPENLSFLRINLHCTGKVAGGKKTPQVYQHFRFWYGASLGGPPLDFPSTSKSPHHSFINPTDSTPPYNTLLNMSTKAQGQAITFSPPYIGTSIVDEEFKLRHLREDLEDESYQFQRKNIEFLIHYYENGGKIPAPGQTIWLLDGKVVDKEPEEIPEGSVVWAEEVCLS